MATVNHITEAAAPVPVAANSHTNGSIITSTEELSTTSSSCSSSSTISVSDEDTERIRAIIKEQGGFESEKETDHRKSVFEEINKIVQKFISAKKLEVNF